MFFMVDLKLNHVRGLNTCQLRSGCPAETLPPLYIITSGNVALTIFSHQPSFAIQFRGELLSVTSRSESWIYMLRELY